MQRLLWLSLTLMGACSVDVEAPVLGEGDVADLNDAGTLRDSLGLDWGGPPARDGSVSVDWGLPPAPDGGVASDTGSSADASIIAQDAGPIEPQDDHGDTLETATLLDERRQVDGVIDRNGDGDFFRFRTTGEGIYTIYTTGDTNTYCTLYAADGGGITSNKDGGEGRNCRIEQSLAGDSIYYVRVRENRTGTGAYILVIEGPREICGDGQLTAGEECDDGNERNGDGCDSECRDESPPDGCEQVDGRGRATIVCFADRLIWSEAKTACEAWDGTLATITERRDHDRFPAFVRRRGSLWIGLNDLEREGRYEWVGRNSNYRNWANGEPNNWGGDEDCIMLRREADSRWNDQGCNAQLGYICER